MALCVIGKVKSTLPIHERLVQVVVETPEEWQSICRVGDVEVGETVLVFLHDAIVPDDWPEFQYLVDFDYRVRTIRRCGYTSDCVVQRIPERFAEWTELAVGEDLTERLGVRKFSLPPPILEESLRQQCPFPAFLPQTGELQVPHIRKQWVTELSKNTVVTLSPSLKYDGTSCTIYRYGGHFGVCSRNLELPEKEGCVYWRVAKQYDLVHTLPEGTAIQLEILGPKINKNRHKIAKDPEAYVFGAIDILKEQFYTVDELSGFVKNVLAMPLVHVFDPIELPVEELDLNTLRPIAQALVAEFPFVAEGVVFRRKQEERDFIRQKQSFKVLL